MVIVNSSTQKVQQKKGKKPAENGGTDRQVAASEVHPCPGHLASWTKGLQSLNPGL